jgi:hypothetical protein
MGRMLFVGSAAMLMLVVACSDDDRPPPVQSCANCGGGTGNGGGGATCTPNPALGTTFTADLNVFVSDRFEEGAPVDYLDPYDGTAEVLLPAAPCGWVSDEYDSRVPGPDGIPEFVLAGAAKHETTWLRMLPFDTLGDPVVPTLMAAETQVSLECHGLYGFVKQTTIDAMIASAGMTRDTQRAQIVVRVNATDGRSLFPTSGATVVAPGTTAVAYDAGGTWSRGMSATGPSGLALLINVAADPYPGNSTVVSVSAADNDEQFSFAVAEGAVTYAQVLVGNI